MMIRTGILFLLGALGLSACGTTDGIKVLQPKAFQTATEADASATILDVRKPDEFAEGHLDKAINLNWKDSVAFEQGLAALDKTRTYYLYCRGGVRSHHAALRMREEGFTVLELKGGYLRWTKKRMPTRREETE